MGEGNNERRPSYVPTSRGLEPYLWAYSAAACKLYEWLRLIAPWQGPNKGIVEFTFEFAKSRINLSPKTISRACGELAAGHLGDVPAGKEAPPFIDILEWPRGGPGKRIKIRIRKAKLTARDCGRTNAGNGNNSKVVQNVINGLAGKMDMKRALGKK